MAAAVLRFGLVGGGCWLFCWTGRGRGRPRAWARSRWSGGRGRGPSGRHKPELGSGCMGEGSKRFATLQPKVKIIQADQIIQRLLLLIQKYGCWYKLLASLKTALGRESLYILTELATGINMIYLICVANPGEKNVKGCISDPLTEKKISYQVEKGKQLPICWFYWEVRTDKQVMQSNIQSRSSTGAKI